MSESENNMSCPLCQTEFVKSDDQKIARWATSWCSTGEGFLCPECYLAAGKIENGAAFDPNAPLSVLPWGSDILKASKTKTDEKFKKQFNSEKMKYDD